MRNRRALSTVIGAVFAIIALTSTVTYISYSMGILNNYNQSVLTKNQQLSDANKENFRISSVTVPNGKLNITVANTGSLPINFTKIWIQNTTTTDWIQSYTPTNNFISPGGVLTNVGQKIPLSINPIKSYNIKLVTSRGNTQQFTVNSLNSLPLNVQFYAFPSTIPSDFTTKLVMIVTNNQSSTVTNLIPQISKTASTASCTPSATANPASINTLSPGNTAVFTWDLKLIGKNNQYCTYQASLQNGFSGNTASTTASISAITATSSNWSTTWGIFSVNYTSLQWTKDNGLSWNNAWSVPSGQSLVWRVNVTNNDPTRQFIINGNSSIVAFTATGGSNVATAFYVIKNPYPPFSAYTTNGQTINSNGTTTIYLGSSSPGVATAQAFPTASGAKGTYSVSILMFGYWTSVQLNNFFGQNIPYEGITVY